MIYKTGPEPELKIVLKSGVERVICGNMPSPPSISPEGKRIAYLSPYEWELLSNVYIYDIERNTRQVVLTMEKLAENKNVRDQFTPKKLAWLDSRYLLMVIQYAYGAVPTGGNLYVYDTAEGSLRPLTKLFERECITGLEVEQDFVYLDFIEFSGELMEEQRELKKAVRKDQVYEAIRKKELTWNFYLVDDLDLVNSMESRLKDYEFDEDMPYEEAFADLNGDGREDRIIYQVFGEYENVFLLKVNNVEVKSYGSSLDRKLYIVDIDKSDGFKEIAIQEFGPSSDEQTYFYSYTGSELKFMGKVGELCAKGGHIPGNGRVISSIRPLVLQTWFVKKEYKLDENHLLEGIEREFYPVRYEAEPLKLKTSLKLYDKPKSKKVAAELKAGDTLKLLGCDGIEWCLAETAAGIKGWFAVDGFTIRENRLYSADVFEGLSFAD